MSTRSKRPIWFFAISQNSGWTQTLTAGSEEEWAVGARAYGALGMAPPTTAGTREMTNDRRYQ